MEVVAKLRERKIAALALTIALLVTIATAPPSPLQPTYQGIGNPGVNWAPPDTNMINIYSLVQAAPKGIIETPQQASTASLIMKPGKQIIGEITEVEPTTGVYAICGEYQLVLNNYSGPIKINNLAKTINTPTTNAINYIENSGGLTILSGTYQNTYLISTGPLNLPPGTYEVTANITIAPTEVTAPIVLATPFTNTILPINAYSTITFEVNINFTGTIRQVIIYGITYGETEATLTLNITKNEQVIGRATTTAPPITQGLRLNPIQFNTSINITPGIYEITITTDKAIILYVTPDAKTSME
jgi:hypothetical protein